MGPASASRGAGQEGAGVHQYFLRSVSSAAAAATPEICVTGTSEASSSPKSDRSSESPQATRTLRKKTSIWNIFARGTRKSKAGPVSMNDDTQTGRAAVLRSSANSVPLPFTQPQMNAYPRSTLSPRDHVPDHAGAGAGAGRYLRSQQSMHTLRSQASTPTLRSARSQYALRRPSGMQAFDNDSMFSDDSETEVVVSWVTSTGLRKAGIDEDDDDDDLLSMKH